MRKTWDRRLKADIDAFDEIDDCLKAGREREVVEGKRVLRARGAGLVSFMVEPMLEMGISDRIRVSVDWRSKVAVMKTSRITL